MFNHCVVWMDALSGQVVGGYELERQLGKGTYGQVFSAKVKNSDQRVAMKRIACNPADECIQLLFREVSILKSLASPVIMEVTDVVVENSKTVWIVTPLFDSDLRVFVKQTFPDRKVPLDLVFNLTRQIVAGVAFCHSRHVWHRDLKPQNILIDWKSRKIRIADFGLAKCVFSRLLPSTRPLTHEIVTLWYRAPEVILGSSQYTAAIDVWSIGVIVLELYSGATQFNGRSEVETLVKIFSLVGTPTASSCPESSQWPNNSVKFPLWTTAGALGRIRSRAPDVDDQWHELVRRALDIDPRKRPCAQSLSLPDVQNSLC